MNRYFLEVRYKGTGFAGFQIQHNADTIQSEVQRAMKIFFRRDVPLTGSSRTDSGVHALQNYFHFDMDDEVPAGCVYNLNSLLPAGIAVLSVKRVHEGAHCRFDAISRSYRYLVYRTKDPFLHEVGYYFPYRVDAGAMRVVADVLREYSDFRSFAKRNSQVKTYECRIADSRWEEVDGHLEYVVKSNRFLRGMVRGLVGTMLQVGRKKIDVDEFRKIVERGDSSMVNFSVPGCGLCLECVEYADGYFG